MLKKITGSVFLGIYLSLITSPILAQNSSWINPSMLPFCEQVRDVRTREIIAQSQNNSSGTVNTNFDMGWESIVSVHGDSSGSGWSNSSSSSNRDYAISQYNSSNCDALLKAASQVTMAEIESDTAKAIERMRMESWKYGQDTQLAIANVNLEAIKNTNQTQQNIAQIHGNTSITTTAIQAGTQIVGGLINPPSRGEEVKANAQVEIARIQAEIEKEKLELERLRIERETQTNVNSSNTNSSNPNNTVINIDQWLTQRELTKTACLPGVVFIVGLSSDTICINPTPKIPSGVYKYDPTIGLLIQSN